MNYEHSNDLSSAVSHMRQPAEWIAISMLVTFEIVYYIESPVSGFLLDESRQVRDYHAISLNTFWKSYVQYF